MGISPTSGQVVERWALSLMVGNDVRDEPSEEEERDEGCADPRSLHSSGTRPTGNANAIRGTKPFWARDAALNPGCTRWEPAY